MSRRARLVRLATVASLSVASALALLKLVGVLMTGSVALLSLLIDGLADIGASALTFWAVRIAQQPPDRTHRFGHGKAEALSALAQSALVAGSALFVVVAAIQRVLRPEPLDASTIGIVITAVSLGVTLLLVLFQRFVIERTGSQAVRADRLHYASDLISNTAVLITLLLTRWFELRWLDPVVGGLIAAFLLRGAAGIGRDAMATLMDQELPDPDRRRVEEIVMAHPEVAGIHDLRSREAAGTKFLEFHIELDGGMSLREAHGVADALEAELAVAFPDSEIMIHQEPAGLEDQRLDDRLEQAG